MASNAKSTDKTNFSDNQGNAPKLFNQHDQLQVLAFCNTSLAQWEPTNNDT